MTDLDFNIFPLSRQAGRNSDHVTGLHAASPPRKASRSRRADRLILLLSFNIPAFSDERLANLLTRLEEIYFQKTGSTTSAMKEMVEDLNNLILNLNLKHAGSRPQVTGTIGVVVVRGDLLFLAQAGPGHLFAMLPGKVEYLHDDSLTLRGLGASRTPVIHYAQLHFSPGDRFVFSTTLPDNWDADTFTAAYSSSIRQTQSRFLADAGEDLQGFLLEAQVGSGKMAVISSQAPQAAPRPEKAAPTPVQGAGIQAANAQATSAEAAVPAPLSSPPADRQPVREPRISQPPARASASPQDVRPEAAATAPSPRSRRERLRGTSPQARQTAANLAPALHKALTGVQSFWRTILKGVKGLLQRLVPGEELVKIPSGAMAFIAVAVPLLVVTVAALVYAQIGRNQQYEIKFSQAQTMASEAANATGLDAQRLGWTTTINLVDEAAEYLVTDESTALRKRAVAALDALDQVTRIEFDTPIVGNLPAATRIIQMSATNHALFLLDDHSDSIMRAFLTGGNYQMDGDFKCGAGQYDSIIVTDLVDFVLLPDNPKKYLLAAMDRSGNLLYCSREDDPKALALSPPDSYWGQPTALAFAKDRLYVLDRQLNMVWYFEPNPENQNFEFSGPPLYFFQEEVPVMLDVVDFSIDQEHIFLLKHTGETISCAFTGIDEAPTTCTAPALYNDTRPDREPAVILSGTLFSQLQNTQPPEPSLFYLDQTNQAVFQFSLKLNLVQQFRPEKELGSGLVTAFAVSPTKNLILAKGNQVYFGLLP